MFVSTVHLVEIAIISVAITIGWLIFRNKFGNKVLLCLSMLIVWIGIFGVYLSAEIIPVKEQVRVTALGTKNDLSANNHICIIGYSVNGMEREIEHPVEGNWAWYESFKGSNVYYSAWFPGNDEFQPPDATNYVVMLLPMGENRSIVFLHCPWYGMAQIEVGGETQMVDTYGNNIAAPVAIPDTSKEFYFQAQKQQFPAFLIVFAIMTSAVFIAVFYATRAGRIDKWKKYKFLFEELIKRDFTLKYKRTILGMIWSIISPLIMLLIMWLVFRDLLGSNINHFAIYMFSGQLVFSFFSDATTQGMTSLLDNSGIFTKINVPKYMFLLSKNISTLINFGLTLIILFIFVAVEGLPFTWKYLMLIYPIGFLILFNVGLGLILSALFVFFRDMQYLWGVFTQLIMWVSAIFYPIETFDDKIQNAFLLNPIYLFIRYFRKIIIDGDVPTLGFHLIIAGYTFVFILVGAWVYKKYNHDFLYYV